MITQPQPPIFMQAIEILEHGSLAVCQRPLPVPGSHEVLIHVAASGMNRADLLQRQGHHPAPQGASGLPGLEVSGVITSVGPHVSKAMIGERVCALLPGGGYAEYAVASTDLCLPVPADMDLVSAAGLPEAIFTVAKNVFIIGQLRPDDHLLIHGGSSGIGSMAIQMAKAIGARVSVTAGTEEKCSLCSELGADLAINYKTEDFVAALPERDVDVVFDMVGGDYINRSLSVMNTDGRHVSIAYLKGSKAEIDIGKVMARRLVLTGSTLRNDTSAEKLSYAEMIRDIFWDEVREGGIRPVIHAKYPLEQAQAAHDAFETGQHSGKILLIQ